jgi:septal ring factor EnvC (AmiA/AmiB activator)
MSRSKNSVVFLIFLLLLMVGNAISQDRRSLEKKRDALDKQISTVNALINASRSEQKATQGDLQLLDRQIALRRDLIATLKSESYRIEKQINETTREINTLEEQMVALKDSYQEMVHYAYRNRSSYDRLSYVFAAASFQQAYKRSRYLNQLADFRRRQADLIEQTTKELESNKVALVKQKDKKTALLKDQEKANQKLTADKAKQQSILAKLRENEGALQTDLQKKKSSRAELDRKIRKLIEEEIRKSKAANKGTFALTPEALELSNQFAKNKGKLPWPVERGVIISRFGVQAHPVLRGIKIENNGVDIATEEGAAIRAVYRGKVSSVIVIPGAGKAVILDHGAYRTVYSPMREVFVQQGEEVNTKQSLGIVLTDGTDRTAHFELWKITDAGPGKEDPSIWLFKQ